MKIFHISFYELTHSTFTKVNDSCFCNICSQVTCSDLLNREWEQLLVFPGIHHQNSMLGRQEEGVLGECQRDPPLDVVVRSDMVMEGLAEKIPFMMNFFLKIYFNC